jgi:hypothetical protein
MNTAYERSLWILQQNPENEPGLAPRAANFKHRNWFRDPETLQKVKSGLELAMIFGYPPRLWG